MRSAKQAAAVADFDGVAGSYRWLEYLSLGSALERMRFLHLDAGLLADCRTALILGDGDGRFTARLMGQNSLVQVTAVDASGRMLDLLTGRCAPFRDRLQTHQMDARSYVPSAASDLVVSHFFLDCLTEAEVTLLVGRVRPTLRPGAMWLVSEFCETAWWSHLVVRGLYLAFRLLTGLTVQRVPAYARILGDAGFILQAEATGLGGLLRTELWHLQG